MTMVNTYELFYTGGGIWCVSGSLNDGRYFNGGELYHGGTLDEVGIQFFDSAEDEEESWENYDENKVTYATHEESLIIFREILTEEVNKNDYTHDICEEYIDKLNKEDTQ